MRACRNHGHFQLVEGTVRSSFTSEVSSLATGFVNCIRSSNLAKILVRAFQESAKRVIKGLAGPILAILLCVPAFLNVRAPLSGSLTGVNLPVQSQELSFPTKTRAHGRLAHIVVASASAEGEQAQSSKTLEQAFAFVAMVGVGVASYLNWKKTGPSPVKIPPRDNIALAKIQVVLDASAGRELQAALDQYVKENKLQTREDMREYLRQISTDLLRRVDAWRYGRAIVKDMPPDDAQDAFDSMLLQERTLYVPTTDTGFDSDKGELVLCTILMSCRAWSLMFNGPPLPERVARREDLEHFLRALYMIKAQDMGVARLIWKPTQEGEVITRNALTKTFRDMAKLT